MRVEEAIEIVRELERRIAILAEVEKSIDQTIASLGAEGDVLFPLGNGVFVEGRMGNSYLVEVGGGVFVWKNREEVKGLLERRKKEVQEERKRIEKEREKLVKRINEALRRRKDAGEDQGGGE